jgi:hypothetical protein
MLVLTQRDAAAQHRADAEPIDADAIYRELRGEPVVQIERAKIAEEAEAEFGDRRPEAGAQHFDIQQLVAEGAGVGWDALADARAAVHQPRIADGDNLARAGKPRLRLPGRVFDHFVGGQCVHGFGI